MANPPVGVVYFQQPPLQVTAGAPFDVVAAVVDKNGDQVFASSDQVTLTLNKNTFAGGGTSASVNAVEGIATFEDLAITTAATGYTLTATSAIITAPNEAPVSDAFDVVAAAAYAMTIVQGDGQTAFAGTTLPVDPTVLVADQYDNPVPGVSVAWTPGGSSSGIVGVSPTTTGADGTTSTTWMIGDGLNQLTASTTNPDLSLLFEATGYSTLQVLNSCEPGGSGDPINAPGKTYAFYIPNPGNNKTIREIQLYLSSNGKANTPTQYEVQLTTQMGTFDPAVSTPVPTTTTVFLRGNSSEKKLTTFVLPTPIVGSAGGSAPDVMIRLEILNNPDNATINFNTGECPPGTSCRPPRGCSVTEVNSVTPYPKGTIYRKSVGIIVKG
jgi:hypothetical protein